MALEIDHALIAVHDLDKAIADYVTLGFTVVPGGLHPTLAKQSARILFSNSTGLELLENPQVDGKVFDEGLIGYALRTSDLAAEIARLRDSGFSLSEVNTHTQERDGRTITWKQAQVTNPALLYIIQDITPRDWRLPLDASLTTHANRSLRMTGFTIYAWDINEVAASYAWLLDVPEPERNINVRNVDFFSVIEHMVFFIKYQDHRLSYLGYLTDIIQGRITDVNPADEPDIFGRLIQDRSKQVEQVQASMRRELLLESVLQNQSEYLYDINLVRENCDSKLFTLERTHGVRFSHEPGVPPERGLDVLIGLDSVDWANLHHAYGPATDVPEHLRALTSDDEDVVKYAADVLSNNITHQGSIYPASIEALPFLMQLIEAPQVNHDAPLDLFKYIGHVGLETTYQPTTRQRLDEVLPAVIRNLTNAEYDVRATMIEMLALYPEQHERMEKLLKELMQTASNPELRIIALQSLVRLWLAVNQTASHKGLLNSQLDYLGGIMQSTEADSSLRCHAALAVVEHDATIWLDQAASVIRAVIEQESDILRAANLDGGTFDFKYTSPLAKAVQRHPDNFLDLLLNLAHHPNHKIRWSVAYHLNQLAKSSVAAASILPTIGLLLDDPNANVRQSAVMFLHRVALPPDFLDKLKRMSQHDRSISVREEAKNTLRLLGKKPQSS